MLTFHLLARHLLGAVPVLPAVWALASCGKVLAAGNSLPSAAVPVRVDAVNGMSRGGKPYFVKGVGGSENIKQVSVRGANSIRTWTTGGLAAILDEAHQHGITVSAGIWLEPESSWFSYQNPTHRAKQADRVRKEVMLYRNHPALLAWGLGNETEGDGSNIAYWQQLDDLARLVRNLDPAHPTFTAIAGMSPVKAAGMSTHAPNLDFVGINTYGALPGLRKHLEKIGWKRPWLLTEWGPRGFWESPKSASGAPLEQTSSEKAEMIQRLYQSSISNSGGCLGSYVFLWGWKFEATATWFGILTHEGETIATADTLQKLWSSTKPVNQAPAIQPLRGVPRSPVAAGGTFEASAKASDPDGDRLGWHWAVLPEQLVHDGTKKLPMPKPIGGTIANASGDRASVKAPKKPGIYRLYVWVKDGRGHAATANFPFEVQ